MKKRVLLVVTGGIAAYKAADVVRKLMAVGAEVKVVMTAAATKFVTPLTFQTLSGNQVGVDMFSDPRSGDPLAHLAFARWAEMVLVSPATANFIAKMAHGLADDLASSTLLATTAPIAVCPAMNDGMWDNPATQENVGILRRRGVHLIGPDAGPLACQTSGKGRMSEPAVIVSELEMAVAGKKLAKVIVTAGATREPVDEVRVLTNVSSGRLGSAIVDACTSRGFEVIWIHSSQAARPGASCIEVLADTVHDVEAAMQKYLADPKVAGLIHCMAISDFQVGGVLSVGEAFSLFSRAHSVKEAEASLAKFRSGHTREKTKISSSKPVLPLLLPGRKLLDSVRKWAVNPDLFVVSFKLTSGATKAQLIKIAKEQLTRGGSDLVVANDSRELTPDGHKAWLVSATKVEGALVGKEQIAREIAARIRA